MPTNPGLAGGGSQLDEAKRQLDAAYNQYLGRSGSDEEYLSHLTGGTTTSQVNIDYAVNNIANSAEAQAWAARNRTGEDPGAYPGEGGTVISPDLYGIRNTLGGYLMDNLLNWTPTPFGGDLSLEDDPLFGQAADFFGQAFQRGQAGYDAVEGSLGPLRQMMETGGAPDITAALEAIRTKGMMDIEDQSAGIRERFGNWGLGQSSDISEYLGRGVSRGVADINAQQSALVAQVMGDAANRKLSASTSLPGILAGVAQGRAALGTSVGEGLLGVGQARQSVKENNLTREYAEFVRMQQINPYLQPSINFATSFAPVRPAIPMGGGGGFDWGSVIGGAASLLPWLIGLSDVNLKENIKPASVDTAAALSTLPIYEWSYKGDQTRHLGPMAQDFQKSFGVGDGRTIHLVDVMGVLLASQKQLMERMGNAKGT